MSATHNDLHRARVEVTASSAAGAPFLGAFALTIFLSGLCALWLPVKTAALVLMFQGNVALPVAFLAEKRLAWGTMAKDNPLRSLSAQLAMSQLAAMPVVLIVWSIAPQATGAALGSIAGAHLVPYAWLHRTAIYVWSALVVSIGTFAMVVALEQDALPWSLFLMAGAYAATAILLYRHARRQSTLDGTRPNRASLAA